jgi:rubredoxin/ferredoxin
MGKYRCLVCGWVYDPARGDRSGAVPVGTPFATLSPEWVCPVCGAGRDQFEPVKDAVVAPEWRIYSRSGLEVVWKPALCNHNGNCTRRLPQVFDPRRRPWVDLAGADPDAIREVVSECPTGALSCRPPHGGA